MHTDTQSQSTTYFIGLISGTSMDAVDAALIQVSDDQPQLVQALSYPYPTAIRDNILPLLHDPESIPYGQIIQMELALSQVFAQAVNQLLTDYGINANHIHAIGCHGQTLCHRPEADPAYTVQLCDNARLAVLTGIPVVADFRRADVAAGGQGAPLASLLHHVLFSHPQHRVGVLNIGGIGNLTVLPPSTQSAPVLGFDTGPGNGLMDQWCRRHQQRDYDQGGAWAASGQIIPALLEALLAEPYFHQPVPKSTGREVFNLHWVEQRYPQVNNLPAADVQATLLELSARTLAHACEQQACDQLAVCGGGAHNPVLMARLQQLLAPRPVTTTDSVGLAPDWVEAVLFGWLAARYLASIPSDLTTITGSDRPRILGALWPP